MCDDTLARLEKLESRFEKLESKTETMSANIKQIKHDTGDMIAMFRALSGGFKVLQMLGRLAKPVSYIAATIAAVAGAWAAIKTGVGK